MDKFSVLKFTLVNIKERTFCLVIIKVYKNLYILLLVFFFDVENSLTARQVSVQGLLVPRCCIFQQAFGCCAPQALFKIVLFSIFVVKAKKAQKVTNLVQNLAKKVFF